MEVFYEAVHENTKIQFFIATVEISMICGTQAWTSTYTLLKRLDSCYNRLLIYALNIKWPYEIKDYVLQYSVYQKLSKQKIINDWPLALNKGRIYPHDKMVSMAICNVY